MRVKSALLLLAGTVVAVAVPTLFWHGVWFGRVLDDSELERYLNDQHPRQVQHALAQLGERIERKDPAVRSWYPSVAQLAESPLPDLRITTAWVMGQDTDSSLFHSTLLQMLEDSEPLVRRNAALSLSRFQDDRALPELREMLLPYPVRSPQAGSVSYLVSEGDWIDEGGVIARLDAKGEETPVRVRVSGQLQAMLLVEGSLATTGDALVLLTPDPKHVWESLRALYLMGGAEELEAVRSILLGPRFSQRIHQQATLTAQAIQERVEKNLTP